MFNFIEAIKADPSKYKQLSCDDMLITEYNCPLENRLQDIWAEHNYFVYVLDGKKVWHTQDRVHELNKGDCAFFRKGAAIVEQFFDATFCVVVFFVPDDFICDTLKGREDRARAGANFPPVMRVDSDDVLAGFFQSMLPYFSLPKKPDDMLLRLKFRELLLNISDNPKNKELVSYFCTVLQEPANISLQRTMEDNYLFNLKLEDYARLCNRSLSAFKRDFQKIFGNTPGKWLMQKRLERARMLLQHSDKQVSDIAFSCGFENLSHFSRSFKEHFGASPAALRREAAV